MPQNWKAVTFSRIELALLEICRQMTVKNQGGRMRMGPSGDLEYSEDLSL